MTAKALTEVWNSVNKGEIREHRMSDGHCSSVAPWWTLASEHVNKPGLVCNEVVE